MGTWGFSSFDNDDATDWITELQGSEDATTIVKALRAVTDLPADEYLEAPEATNAVAAAEVIACLKGARAVSLPTDVEEWLDSHGSIRTEELVPLALQALDRVKSESELKELVDESDEAEEWYSEIADLEGRLKD
jgi:hypothetical protein